MKTERNEVTVSRRTTIKWLAATMAAAGPGCSTSGRFVGEEIPPAPNVEASLLGTATAPGNLGYGGDPDLLNPTVPWPRTMTEAQLNATAALGDLILPADDLSPAASAIGVHEFIDEWVSAPYPDQRIDRVLILEGLEWLERQCRERFDTSFANAAPASQSELIEIIAHPENVDVELARQALFFGRFRYLAVGAYWRLPRAW
jgi:hypothetical protein